MKDFIDGFDGDDNDGNGNGGFPEEDFGDDAFFENEIMDDVDDMDDMDDLCDDDLEADDEERVDTESDEFTVKDAFIFGGAMGWAYEEGFLDGSHQRRRKKSEGLSREKREKTISKGMRDFAKR